MDHQDYSNDSSWVNTFVFIAGAILGAGAALLLTPESGNMVRDRIARGAKTAQDEFSDMASDTKETLHTLSANAQEKVKQAKTRVTAAVDATKQSVKSVSPQDPID